MTRTTQALGAKAALPLPRLVRVLHRQEGFTMPFAILVLVLGTFMVMPVLSYLSTVLQGYFTEREQTMMRVTAEAAIQRVIADLRRGADGIPTTYLVEQPHLGGQPYDTFTVSTAYTPPSLALNDYAATVSISAPSVSGIPTATQQYADPGLAHPQFANLQAGNAYLVRLFRVEAGTLQVNWAYLPQGISRIGVWKGFPVDNTTGQPYQPGVISSWPREQPILDTGFSPGNATYSRTAAIAVDAGVYTIAFDNSRGQVDKTTAPFAPSGGTGDTWIYVKAYRDYVITATAGNVTVKAYVRQIPGYTQAPTGAWSVTNPAWITSDVYIYSWNPPD